MEHRISKYVNILLEKHVTEGRFDERIVRKDKEKNTKTEKLTLYARENTRKNPW